jgi:hypothetical protein
MIGFLIKKTFFDLWDNLFRVALINLGFIASAAALLLMPALFGSLPSAGMFFLFLGTIWCFIYFAAAARSLTAVSDYGSFGFADFFRNLKTAWPAGLMLGLLVFAAYLLVTLVIPFYMAMNSLIGLLLSAVIFWTVVVAFLSLQFFLPIRSRLDRKIRKALKKSFIIFFDNPLFCIFSFFHNLVLLVISVFLALLFPGPAGILLYLDEALRLRLLKYDWLEANPEADRRKIPWEVILIEEQEKTGPRSFKNFIFPWKD